MRTCARSGLPGLHARLQHTNRHSSHTQTDIHHTHQQTYMIPAPIKDRLAHVTCHLCELKHCLSSSVCVSSFRVFLNPSASILLVQGSGLRVYGWLPFFPFSQYFWFQTLLTRPSSLFRVQGPTSILNPKSVHTLLCSIYCYFIIFVIIIIIMIIKITQFL